MFTEKEILKINKVASENSFELNQEQIQRIRVLESKDRDIMNRLSRL